MEKLIKFCLMQLRIYDVGDLRRKWDDLLDCFFYFNKCKGCGVPSFDEVRRYL